MSTQPFDYAAILADLEAKKAAIETAIASMRQAMGLGALGQTGDAAAVPSGASPSLTLHNGEIPNGAFLGKSIPEAAKLYLEILKKKQTSREIADALLKGGMESTSKNFSGIVHAVLDRARKSPNSALVKLGSHWGLAGWYPKGIISSAAAPAAKKGKKKNRKAKPTESSKSPAMTAAEPPKAEQKTEPTSQPGGVKNQIIEILRSTPTAEFTATGIAQKVGKQDGVIRMMLGTLVSKGLATKTPSGGYQATA
jgi:hypothetical protein